MRQWARAARYAAAGTLVCARAACAGTDFSWSQARQLQAGMSPQQVEAVMGRPYMVTVRGDETIWVWAQGTALGSARSLSVAFRDGLLTKPPALPDGL